MVRFGLSMAAALALVGVGTALVSRHIVNEEAVRDARVRTTGIAEGIAAPLVNDAVRRGDPAAVRALDTAMRNRMRDGSVAHVVVYDRDGRILWADDPGIVGSRESLRPEVLRATADGGAIVTDTEDHPRESHSTSEREGALVEVYVGARDADGEPFIFEAYTPRALLQSDTRTILGEVLPLTLGSLLLLAVLVLPLSLSLARRVDRSSTQRAIILRRSLHAWHRERARIAQVLHDDVIQDLSALGYSLPGVLQQLPETPEGETARRTGQQLNDVAVETLRTLRGMLADLVPTGLDGSGLAPTLEALAQRQRDAGLPVRTFIDPELTPAATVGGLVYRAVREGLLNVRHHAEASEACVEVHQRGQWIDIVVEDDGRGPGEAPPASAEHVGLRLLGRLLGDVGGRVELVQREPRGARLHVAIPAHLPDLEGSTRD
ncbi:sensor histidine kinase [Nocardioides sp. GCM10027113]|uniref:sensor histidine kinase n=1 Tax=unclassified Nocardioides TaxID=2615069 RepID=UPI00361FD8E2